jgi:putative SOS response-associated peptidase YedK
MAFELRVSSVVGDEPAPSWNVAPTQEARVVIERPDPDDVRSAPLRQLRSLRWGLVPGWAHDPRIGSRLINARAETVTEKPAFAAAAARRRCLVPADGYYEWERRPGEPSSVPHFLHRGDEPLWFAGLYEFWVDQDRPADDPGRWLASFTIVTTTAADALGHIHDRSPVVVPAGLRDAWLDPMTTDLETVHAMLASMPDPQLDAHEVSTAVNDHRNNGPDLVAALTPTPDLGCR